MRSNWHSIREFEALRATIAAGTTTGAARRLGVSQSAISRALSQLEARTGRSLFEREAGRIAPTAEALNLNEKLDPLFDALAQIDGEDWTGTTRETLRLVAPPTIAHRFVVPRIAGFLKTDPARRISLEICTSDDLVRGILEDRFDVGITSAAITRAGMKLLPFRLSRLVCVMATRHPLVKRSRFRPEHFDGVDIVALSRRHAMRALIDQSFAAAGVAPNPVIEVATSVAAVELARAGVGVAFVNPFPLLQGETPDLAVRPFAVPHEYRTSFALSASRPPSALARAFMRHIKMTTAADPFSNAM